MSIGRFECDIEDMGKVEDIVMACNNTTYRDILVNSTEMLIEMYKHKYFVDLLSYNIPFAMMVNKCVTPIWFTIGVFGNIISALVWANPRMRTCNTAAYYLTSLAVSDLAYLVFHLLYELESPWLLATLDVQVWCQAHNIANMALQYFCVFLVLAFTVERFLSVCHPFKSERFGKTRTPRTILSLFVTAFVLSLPQGYSWHINEVGECQVRRIEMDPRSFFPIYTWCTELAIFGVIPLIVLMLNSAVLNKIRTIGQLRLGKPKLLAHDRRQCHESSMSALVVGSEQRCIRRVSSSTNGGFNANNKGTTVTLLWVSFFLIFTMLPNTIVYALQSYMSIGRFECDIEDMGKDPAWRSYFSFTSVKYIVKEISLSHHVGNVFIYLATSRRFLRLTLKSFFGQKKPCGSETKETSMHTIRAQQNRTVLGEDV
ncbi:hypothetical protein Btru_061699 [Bulinus truncatus]|nr:hypothetical protein Btru_061699 [Bulinus truncatus]